MYLTISPPHPTPPRSIPYLLTSSPPLNFMSFFCFVFLN